MFSSMSDTGDSEEKSEFSQQESNLLIGSTPVGRTLIFYLVNTHA